MELVIGKFFDCYDFVNILGNLIYVVFKDGYCYEVGLLGCLFNVYLDVYVVDIVEFVFG